jgi:prepilin-type N-terminal cleavage/methylation domain-containing protein
MLRKVEAFTLVELIIVVIIVGILASLGLTQYSQIVEKSRLAEAKVNIGVMRQLAHEYYLNNGDMSGITSDDVGGAGVCNSGSFYRYIVGGKTATEVALDAYRCTSGGKSPNASRQYVFWMVYVPSTGQSTWYCHYSDNWSTCFGLP